ncbi:tripartite tricarboxylate transporter TctB family protein [Patulibacter sp. SYSU D01012]|uniref:tripartite tricarboxylate transporter TctB family protein n=1 Tax=Patulibacter sp. SYSU D01012 TaxID=2817381 RepID=UPI001B303203|nr:tripartite tricarboxylate transporter TctB family protein [Patulibacter sp. SYSU D01012]
MSTDGLHTTTTEPARGVVHERHVPWAGPRLVGVVLLALGVASLVATTAIHSAELGWSLEGPRMAPLIGSVALIVLSLLYLLRTVWRPDVDLARFAANEAEATHWPTPGALLAALVGYALLLGTLGYALATTVFVWLVSWLLGSRSPGRDAIVAVALGVGVGYAFSRWLGVRLPAGPWGI